MKNSDTLLVGFDHSNGDIAVLIIGRKDAGEKVQIINQFQGKEAEELYKKLVGKDNLYDFHKLLRQTWKTSSGHHSNLHLR